MVYSRIWLLGELIADSIFEDRLNALLNNKPYDLKEFNDICDDEFLIDVKKSNIKFSDSIIINNINMDYVCQLMHLIHHIG